MDSAGTAVRPLAARDVRAPGDVGRHARLELRFGVRDGRTRLLQAYAEPPFRVGRSFPEGDGLHLILVSSAPGIFGGDHFTQHIVLEAGARVRLTSQSALQAHPSVSGEDARIVSHYQVARGGTLQCTWDPLIPFPDARLSQTTTLDVDADASLQWSDAFMAGREARGERWRFAWLSYELLLRRAGRLAYLERYVIEPGAADVSVPWSAGDASYFGSALLCGESAVDAEALHGQVAAHRDVYGAADRLEKGLTLVRLMSASGVAFHRARKLVEGR